MYMSLGASSSNRKIIVNLSTVILASLDPYQGFIHDFLLGGGGNNVSVLHPLPPKFNLSISIDTRHFQSN